MAVLFISGFETRDFKEWTSTSGTPVINTSIQPTGNCCAQLEASEILNYQHGSTLPDFACSFKFRGEDLPSFTNQIFEVTDSGFTLVVQLKWQTDGKLILTTPGSTVGSATLSVDTWYEIHVTHNYVDGSNDEVNIYIDDDATPDISVTTASANDGQYFAFTGLVDIFYFDDIRIDDVVTKIGSHKVVRADPIGNGVSTWDSGTYASVDDWITVVDDDTTTEAQLTSDGYATDALDNISALGISSGDTINAIKMTTVMKRDGGGAGNHFMRIYDGSGNRDSGDLDPSMSHVLYWFMEDGSMPTASGFDSWEFGAYRSGGGGQNYEATANALMVDYTPSLQTVTANSITSAEAFPDFINSNPGVYRGTKRVFDSFTEGTNKDLDAHTPDDGTGYTLEEKTGTSILRVFESLDDCRPSATEFEDRVLYSCQPDPTVQEYTLRFRISNLSVIAEAPFVFFARFVDTSNYYAAGLDYNGADYNFEIWKIEDGTPTQIDLGTATLAVDDIVEFVVLHASKKLYRNGVEIASTSDNDLVDKGKVGIGTGNIWNSGYDIRDAWRVDDFTFSERNRASSLILPNSILSGEVFGNPTVTISDVADQTVTTNSISSAEAFGTTIVDVLNTISPLSISSAEVIGSLTIGLTISANSISSAETFGTHTLALTINTNSITSAEAFGTTSVIAGVVTLQPNSVSSAEAFGSLTIGLTVESNSITSAEAFGSHTVTAGVVTLQPNSIPSAEAFGTHVLGITVEPNSIPSAEAFGTITIVAGNVNIITNSIPSAEAFGVYTLSLTIDANSISSSETFGSHNVITDITLQSNSILPANSFIGDELIIGGQDMADADWVDAGSPTTNEQTDHDGQTNCRHVVATVQYVDGVKQASANNFTTITGRTYRVTWKMKKIVGSIYCRVRKGDDSGENVVMGAAPSSWTDYSVDYTETGGGSGAYMNFTNAAASPSEFYIDEVFVVEIFNPTIVAGNVNISPSSIISDEVFGTTTIIAGSVTVITNSISSEEAFGTPVLGITVEPNAILSAEAFGTTTISTSINVTTNSITSAETFGTQQVNLTISLTGILSAEAVGNPTIVLAAGDQTVTTNSITSAEAFGSLTIGMTAEPNSIISAETFGTNTVVTVVTLQPNSITSEEAFGTQQVNLSVTVNSISSAEVFGTHTVTNAAIILPSQITSAEAFGTTTVVAGVATITTNSIASSEAIGSLTTGLSVSTNSISSAEAFGTHTVNLTIEPSSITSAEAFGTETVVAGTITLLVSSIISAEDFGTLSISTRTLTPNSISSGEIAGNPTVVLAGGTQTLTTNAIPSAEAFGTTTVLAGVATITANSIPSEEAFGTYTLSLTVDTNSISSSEAFGSHNVTNLSTITASSIPSAEAFGTHSLSITIEPNSITSAEAFGTTTVLVGAATITASSILSAEVFGTAIITNAAIVSPSSIISAEAFGTLIISTRTLVPNSIISAEAFGELTVVQAAGLQTISPSSISSAETFGNITIDLSVVANSITSAEAFGSLVVNTFVTVSANAINSQEIVGSPTISNVNLIVANGIPSAESVENPTIGLTVMANSILSQETVSNPKLNLFVAVNGIASAEAFGTVNIAGEDRTITSNSIASLEAFGLLTISASSSKRWLIIKDIMNTLEDITVSNGYTNTINFVTDEPVDYDEIQDAQIPFAIVDDIQNSDETIVPLTNIHVDCDFVLNIIVVFKATSNLSKNIDSVIKDMKKALYLDITRNGNADFTALQNISMEKTNKKDVIALNFNTLFEYTRTYQEA